jgi:hypothetical protein
VGGAGLAPGILPGPGLLVLLAGMAYLLPRPADLDPFYSWTRGWPTWLALAGLACLVGGLEWAAGVLAVYVLAS